MNSSDLTGHPGGGNEDQIVLRIGSRPRRSDQRRNPISIRGVGQVPRLETLGPLRAAHQHRGELQLPQETGLRRAVHLRESSGSDREQPTPNPTHGDGGIQKLSRLTPSHPRTPSTRMCVNKPPTPAPPRGTPGDPPGFPQSTWTTGTLKSWSSCQASYSVGPLGPGTKGISSVSGSITRFQCPPIES